jgi:hypothetical protein
MAVQLTKKFWFNLILFIVSCIALGIAIWAFAIPCKKSESFSVKDIECKTYLENYPINKGGYYKTRFEVAKSIVKDITGVTETGSCPKDDDLTCAMELLDKFQIGCGMSTQAFCSLEKYHPNKCVFRPKND